MWKGESGNKRQANRPKTDWRWPVIGFLIGWVVLLYFLRPAPWFGVNGHWVHLAMVLVALTGILFFSVMLFEMRYRRPAIAVAAATLAAAVLLHPVCAPGVVEEQRDCKKEAATETPIELGKRVCWKNGACQYCRPYFAKYLSQRTDATGGYSEPVKEAI
jgi:hypothetical protein